jgi:hypothetical protein
VKTFDEAAGLGEVVLGDLAVTLPFHCTAIADGSRSVQVGIPVAVTVATTSLGAVEASRLTPAG